MSVEGKNVLAILVLLVSFWFWMERAIDETLFVLALVVVCVLICSSGWRGWKRKREKEEREVDLSGTHWEGREYHQKHRESDTNAGH